MILIVCPLAAFNHPSTMARYIFKLGAEEVAPNVWLVEERVPSKCEADHNDLDADWQAQINEGLCAYGLGLGLGCC